MLYALRKAQSVRCVLSGLKKIVAKFLSQIIF